MTPTHTFSFSTFFTFRLSADRLGSDTREDEELENLEKLEGLEEENLEKLEEEKLEKLEEEKLVAWNRILNRI